MIERVKDLPTTLSMTFILGDHSWINRRYIEPLKDTCGRPRVHICVSLCKLINPSEAKFAEFQQ